MIFFPPNFCLLFLFPTWYSSQQPLFQRWYCLRYIIPNSLDIPSTTWYSFRPPIFKILIFFLPNFCLLFLFTTWYSSPSDLINFLLQGFGKELNKPLKVDIAYLIQRNTNSFSATNVSLLSPWWYFSWRWPKDSSGRSRACRILRYTSIGKGKTVTYV